MTLSAAAQDYLKAIYKEREDAAGHALGSAQGSAQGGASASVTASVTAAVTTQALAERLDVAPASATSMVKKLAVLHLVEHEPYRGVTLTPAGEKIALEVIRHHRLVETFLTQVLGMDWDRVHDEAEKWEHVLSEEVEAHMDRALASPTHDPHGAPIPSREGVMPQENGAGRLRLLDAAPSASSGKREAVCVVRRVSDREPEVLKFLREIGVVPGARLQVLPARAEEGLLRVRLLDNGSDMARGAEAVQVLGARPASLVWVTLEATISEAAPLEATPGEAKPDA